MVKVYYIISGVLYFASCGIILSTIKIMAKFIEYYKYDYNLWSFDVKLES